MELYLILFIAGIAAFALLTFISILFGDNVSIKEDKRVAQIKKQEAKKDELSEIEKKQRLVQNITQPVVNTVFDNYKPKSIYVIQRKLHVTGWDTYFSPVSWLALRLIMIAAGVVLAWFLSIKAGVAALVIGIVIACLPEMMLNNEYKNIREDLIIHFPETIRIISGYLSVGLILPKAFEMTAKTAKPRWKKILTEFSSRCKTDGDLEALTWIKEEVDLMEAREFFASVRLAIEDGIPPIESFEKQAVIIQRLLDDAIQKRIEKRKLLGTILQGPLLLLILVTFALPIVGTIMDFF